MVPLERFCSFCRNGSDENNTFNQRIHRKPYLLGPVAEVCPRRKGTGINNFEAYSTPGIVLDDLQSVESFSCIKPKLGERNLPKSKQLGSDGIRFQIHVYLTLKSMLIR